MAENQPANTKTYYNIFDSHAHYDDNAFKKDREQLLSETLPQKGVCGIVNMGSSLKSCYQTVELTEKYDYIHGAVGIHPECAKDLPNDWLDTLQTLLKHEKIVAVGEIGLDYHWLDSCPKDQQHAAFTAQLELAEKLQLPVVLHDRDAHGDMMDYIRKYRPNAVLHCFSGSVEMAKELVKLGIYIGMGGVVTFKNARHAVETIQEIPLELLLLETDAPYLAPVPFRGKINDSSLISHVAERIAEIRGITAKEILEITAENARRFFRIS
jgi:hydrolase, TatD family